MNKKTYLIFLCLFVIFISIFSVVFFRSTPTPPNPSNPPPLISRPASPQGGLTPHFPSSSQPTTLVAVGDIMLGRYVNVKMLEHKDYKYPFLKIAEITSNADITFGNLESPIVDKCLKTSVGMIFCTPPQAVEGLKYAGFDVLSIANNHILNHGQKGYLQTTNFLTQNGISPSIDNLIIRKLNNLTIGFLSFDLITYPQSPVIKIIKENSSKVDILIVSLHWGNEYAPQPSESQKTLAHQIIDNGAKILIGHHPHVIQPTESYHKGLIFYSLGNFVFDQPWSEPTKKGEIAKIIFSGKEVKSYELLPVYIEDSSQPRLINWSF